MIHRLFKYFNQQYRADEFLQGRFRMWSLAYYRDYEDNRVRSDANEGKAHHRPIGGLRGTNLTQGRDFHLPNTALTSTAQQDEIFIYCLSRSFTGALWDEFQAVTCIEILNVAHFCQKVTAALPVGATFPGRPGHQRIGNRVEYYSPSDPAGTRHSLPDQIAISKFRDYSRQQEFRLALSTTNAFAFQNTKMALEHGDAAPAPRTTQHAFYDADVGSLADICLVRPARPE
jgi:hypothetical protein